MVILSSGFAEARASLEELLLQVGSLVEALPELASLELNPVILSDGRAIVTQAPLRRV